jgi:hypothetical protein
MAANPFAFAAAACLCQRRRSSRLRDLVSSIVRRFTGLTSRLGVAVDVGFGTGISTRALSPLADMVIGVEPPQLMLERAEPVDDATYQLGSTEELPVGHARRHPEDHLEGHQWERVRSQHEDSLVLPSAVPPTVLPPIFG